MQNLMKDHYVWVIYVNGKIDRKKKANLSICNDEYIEENIYENYILLYKSYACYDSTENKFFKNITDLKSNVFGTAIIIKENESVDDNDNPKELIANILNLSHKKEIGPKFSKSNNHKYEISKNSSKLF
jgi:hypothetical protein